MFQNTKQMILKVTRGCNLRCSYCYVLGKDDYQGEVMSEETFTQVVERYFQESNYGTYTPYEDDKNQSTLSIVFHGGEPTTIGKTRFMKFCKIAHSLARKYKKVVSLSIQTNATLIDDEWIAIFRKYKVDPGLSVDGFVNKSDDERKATDNNQLQIIMKLLSAGMFNGILMVLHKSNYKDIWANFKVLESIGIHRAKVNRGVDVLSPTHSDYELTADELMEAYSQVFDYMMANPDFSEENMRMWFEKYLTQTSKGIEGKDYGMHCYTRYCGAGTALIEIEPNGAVQFCGRNSKINSLNSPGDIREKDVLELSMAKKVLEFNRNKLQSIVTHKCNLCHAQAICDGGCIAFSSQKLGKGIIDPITCAFTKKMHIFLTKHDTEIKSYMKERTTPNESNSYYYL